MRRVDPWGIAVAAVGAVVFMLHGFGGELSRDLALYAYAGQQFADGVPPYTGVLNRAGPLAHMVPGLGALIAQGLGTDDLLTMRVLMMVLTVVAVWLTYLLGRDMFGSRGAGIAAAATLLASRAVILYAGGGPREKTTMMLLVICALYAIVHRKWGWTGVATALAALTWQPAFVLCLGAAVVAAAIPPWRKHWRDTVSAWATFAAGGMIATALMTLYFVVVGELDAFLEGFLLINATNTRQSGLLLFLWQSPLALYRAFGWSLLLLLAGALASLVLGWQFRGSRDAAGRAVVGTGVATIMSALWSLRAFNGWPDAMFVIPVSALGMAGALVAAAHHLSGRRTVAAIAAYAVVVTTAAGVTAWYHSPDNLAPLRAEVEAMLEAAGPEVTVQSIGAPQPLVLGHLRNPIRHQMFLTGLEEYLDTTEPGGMAGIAADIEERRPTLVTLDRPHPYVWVRPVLKRNYLLVGDSDRFSWYADRSLGEERLSELSKILAGAP